MGISEQSTLLCEQKLLTSRQIFRYAVPARTDTKKALPVSHFVDESSQTINCAGADNEKVTN